MSQFDPQKHSFAFGNRWPLSDREKWLIRKSLTAIIDAALVGWGYWDILPFAPDLPSPEELKKDFHKWAEENMDPLGLCGGMAFAALDYYKYRDSIPFPRKQGHTEYPPRSPAKGSRLRRYLVMRLIDSFRLNGLNFVLRMAIRHLPQGERWLCHQTSQEIGRLKKRIDKHHAWPIGLIGTTTNPFENHQVLAYDCENNGSTKATIAVYDMNCPNVDGDPTRRTIELKFGGGPLQASQSYPENLCGELRNIFCENYIRKIPPEVDWP